MVLHPDLSSAVQPGETRANRNGKVHFFSPKLAVGLRERSREVRSNRAIYEFVRADWRELKEEGRISNERASEPLNLTGAPQLLPFAASISSGACLGAALSSLRILHCPGGWS